MIKQLIFIGLLLPIVAVEAMDHGAKAAANGAAKAQSRAASQSKQGAHAKQNVQKFIALIQEFVSPSSRPELKEQMREMLNNGLDLDLEVGFPTPVGTQYASVNKAFYQFTAMNAGLQEEIKKGMTKNILQEARESGELSQMASERGISIQEAEQMCRLTQAAIDGGMLERLDELQALFNEHKAGLLINGNLTDDETSEVENQTESAVSFESVEALMDTVSQFVETNDSCYKDEIAQALASGADRKLLAQAVSTQEAKLQRLTLNWDEFQATRSKEFESRVTCIMAQEKELNREQAVELLKGEYTRSQTFIQGAAAARVQQLKDLLEGKSENDVTIPDSTNKTDGSDAEPVSDDAPSQDGWGSWFSYKKAVVAVGVAIAVAVVGKKVYDERNKKDTRIV